MDLAWLKDHVRDVPDFPQPGIVFKDISLLLGDAEAFGACVDTLAESFADAGVEKVVGIEARGFILAAPVAYRFGAGFVPVRKAGKLPWKVDAEEYVLEYGTGRLEVHADAVRPGERVLIVDDVLATGGTAAATVRLLERAGATVAGMAVIIELAFLGGRAKLEGRELVSLITYG